MPDAIIDGVGSGYAASVNASNRLMVQTEGISVGSLSVTAGSESYIPAGSVIITNTVDVLGSINVDNPSDIGSLAIQDVQGSVNVANGSLNVYGTFSATTGSQNWIQNWGELGSNITGSVAIVTNPVPISGELSVTVGSESWIKNVVGVTPSGTFTVSTGAYLGSEAYQGDSPWVISGEVTIGDTGSVRAVIGAGSVTINNPATIGSISTQTIDGTVTVTDLASAGSLAIQTIIGSVGISTGSLNVYGNIATTPGSQNWIQNFSDLGSNITGSIAIVTDPVPISGNINVTTGSETWVKNFGDLGSTVVVDAPETIGSLAIQTVDGTVTVTGIETAGSLATQGVIGSVEVTNGSLNVYGTFSADVGSESWIKGGSLAPFSGTSYIDVTQTTDPWIVLGSVNVTNSVEVGSLAVQTVDGTIDIGDTGSVRAVIDNPASIGSLTTQGVNFSSGTGYIDVIQTTDPWVVSGNVLSSISSPEAVGSYTTQTVDGTISVTDLASAGSLAIQTINGSIYATGSVNLSTTPVPVSGLFAWNGIGSIPLSSAVVNAASGTTVEIVTGIAASNINVYAYKLVCGSTLSLSWLDEDTAMEGSQFFAANGGVVESTSPPSYLFRAGTGSALKLATTGNVAGRVSYFVG